MEKWSENRIEEVCNNLHIPIREWHNKINQKIEEQKVIEHKRELKKYDFMEEYKDVSISWRAKSRDPYPYLFDIKKNPRAIEKFGDPYWLEDNNRYRKERCVTAKRWLYTILLEPTQTIVDNLWTIYYTDKTKICFIKDADKYFNIYARNEHGSKEERKYMNSMHLSQIANREVCDFGYYFYSNKDLNGKGIWIFTKNKNKPNINEFYYSHVRKCLDRILNSPTNEIIKNIWKISSNENRKTCFEKDAIAYFQNETKLLRKNYFTRTVTEIAKEYGYSFYRERTTISINSKKYNGKVWIFTKELLGYKLTENDCKEWLSIVLVDPKASLWIKFTDNIKECRIQTAINSIIKFTKKEISINDKSILRLLNIEVVAKNIFGYSFSKKDITKPYYKGKIWRFEKIK